MKNYLILLLLCMLTIHVNAQEVNYELRGKVVNAVDQQPLPGASVTIKGSNQGTITDANGEFVLMAKGEVTLVISYIGYAAQEMKANVQSGDITVLLAEDVLTLGEVEVVSTGYQELAKERSTGSFAHLGEEMVNRSVSPDIVSRLEGITPGLYINHRGETRDIIIRGRSTLFANDKPLIVVDNFIYEGDVEDINPNDVKSITVLKDAAAASIWGARAGNGVIVITTKRGRTDRKPEIFINSNITRGTRPDAFYNPTMGVADYIATEKTLFENGYYNAFENSIDHKALSPVVELLIAQRDGLLSDSEVNEQLARLSQHNVGDDFNEHLYRPSFNQQYFAGINGGGELHGYSFSVGYDKSLENLVGNENSRITLQAKNDWCLINERLRISTGLYTIHGRHINNGIAPSGLRLSDHTRLPAYVRLTDENGYPAALTQNFNNDFKNDAVEAGFLDWDYRPLEEIDLQEKGMQSSELRATAGISYSFSKSISLDLGYQYWQNLNEGKDHYKGDSYFARNLINSFTQINGGTLSRPIPEGGILDLSKSKAVSHNGRVQLNFNKIFAEKHAINALGGFEVKETVVQNNSTRYYGYDNEIMSSVPVDYTTRYVQSFYQYSRIPIPNKDEHALLTDRFVSNYFNASYTYDQRYQISGSARKDQSNLFGVNANQKGVPLWSAGAGWYVSNEAFFNVENIEFLKLRATYGFSGNIDKTVTAYTTARLIGIYPFTGFQMAQITNPPNADLQWETIRTTNLGLDFDALHGRISGSFDYFIKKGKDVIGSAPISATSGQREYKGNVADISGHGFEIILNTINMAGAIGWQTQWLLSKAVSKVDRYDLEQSPTSMVEYGGRGVFPVEGHELFSIYSFPSAGLDPDTGDPRGFRGGEISNDYTSIINNATVDSLVYHGSARPKVFGGIRNTITWKGLSLSFNISYSLGYYFRRPSIVYGNDMGLGGHADYYQRWKASGDELYTNVPSLPVVPNSNRDKFYSWSDVLVEKGDNVRLQDINLTWTIGDWEKMPFEKLQIYGYVYNPGILWKATDKVKDPDYRLGSPPRAYSLGLRMYL